MNTPTLVILSTCVIDSIPQFHDLNNFHVGASSFVDVWRGLACTDFHSNPFKKKIMNYGKNNLFY